MAQIKKFADDNSDGMWYGFAGCERFENNEAPRYMEHADILFIADQNGVEAYIGEDDEAFMIPQLRISHAWMGEALLREIAATFPKFMDERDLKSFGFQPC